MMSNKLKLNNFLVYDKTIEDIDILIEGVESSVVLVEIEQQNFISELRKIITSNKNFEIHILAHGFSGGISIENKKLNKVIGKAYR